MVSRFGEPSFCSASTPLSTWIRARLRHATVPSTDRTFVLEVSLAARVEWRSLAQGGRGRLVVADSPDGNAYLALGGEVIELLDAVAPGGVERLFVGEFEEASERIGGQARAHQ